MINKNEIGIIGAGTMGNGIAHVFSLYGYEVILVDINNTILEKAINNIKINMQRQFKKNVITESKMLSAINKIYTSTDIKDLKNSFLVVEAIKEDINL